jgi:hypothetical protein
VKLYIWSIYYRNWENTQIGLSSTQNKTSLKHNKPNQPLCSFFPESFNSLTRFLGLYISILICEWDKIVSFILRVKERELNLCSQGLFTHREFEKHSLLFSGQQCSMLTISILVQILVQTIGADFWLRCLVQTFGFPRTKTRRCWYECRLESEVFSKVLPRNLWVQLLAENPSYLGSSSS